MDWQDRCTLTRVRLLALTAEFDAGGHPRPARLTRALDPIAGDLVIRLAHAGDVDAGESPADRDPSAERTQL